MSTDCSLTNRRDDLSPFLREFLSTSSRYSLQITSVCGAGCIFCSNRHNPFTLPRQEHRSLEDIRLQLEAVEPKRGIIELGLTTPGRLAEGDPLIHPQLFEILEMIRERFMGESDPITVFFSSLGTKLDEAFIDKLLACGLKVKFDTLSANSCHLSSWRKLTGGSEKAARTAMGAPPLLKKAGIPYVASIVMCPALVGYQDIKDTVQYLVESGAREVVLWEPGVSRFTDPSVLDALRFDRDELLAHVGSWQRQWGGQTPILLYPRTVSGEASRRMRQVIGAQDGPTLILTSEAAFPALLAEVTALGASHVVVRPVHNESYGGNIRVAGLLLVEDFQREALAFLARSPKPQIQRIILPSEGFDILGRDLVYVPYSTMERVIKERFNIHVSVQLERRYRS